MANVFIIDDDSRFCDLLKRAISKAGHSVDFRNSLNEGFQQLSSNNYDVVLLDVKLPDGNGLELLPRIKAINNSPEVIVMTGIGDKAGAEKAIKDGAWDYIEKTSSLKVFSFHLERALQYRHNRMISAKTIALDRCGITGNSPRIKDCIDKLAHAANSDANVLITGETGTGKELFANAIHKNSSRRNKNFVIVDCAALPDTLVESILFGHTKGAFTGANENSIGLIKQADGGTLFLDEIGELPIMVQGSFLRALQEKKFRPVGSETEIASDFRVIAATNRDLEEMGKKGIFRLDLLFRLRTFNIELPSLRERTEDIREIAMYYVTKLCKKYEEDIKGFSPEFFEALLSYSWPGNIREMVNALERALLSARHEPILYPTHLPPIIRIALTQSLLNETPQPIIRQDIAELPSCKVMPPLKTYRTYMADKAEKKYLKDLISITKGNVKSACEISGLKRARLYDLLKKHNLSLS